MYGVFVLYVNVLLFFFFYIFFLMIRRPPRSTLDRSSAASDVYKRQTCNRPFGVCHDPHACSFTRTWTLDGLVGYRLLRWVQYHEHIQFWELSINAWWFLWFRGDEHPRKCLGRSIDLLLFCTYHMMGNLCLLYTSDAADERSSVDLGGRRIIKKKKTTKKKITADNK